MSSECARLCSCGKIATWQYDPGPPSQVACDVCVPRGCSCNAVLKPGATPVFDQEGFETNPPHDYEQAKDEIGRAYPCIEWSEIK